MCVALGVDILADIIIEIPFIKELELDLRVLEPSLIAHHIRVIFPVIYRETALTHIHVDKEKVYDVDSEEGTDITCDDPPRVSFKSDTRLISAPLASLF